MPDYLRHLDNPANNIDVAKEAATKNKDTMTVVSKINGWITVDPDTMNRREAYEKRRKLSNIRKTSMMAPTWMQCHAQRDEQRL
jgi:hypothetical protein